MNLPAERTGSGRALKKMDALQAVRVPFPLSIFPLKEKKLPKISSPPRNLIDSQRVGLVDNEVAN